MKNDSAISRFSVDNNQETVTDLFDVEDCVAMIVDGLMEADNVPPEVWISLELLRTRLDDMAFRSLVYADNVRQLRDKNTEKSDSTS